MYLPRFSVSIDIIVPKQSAIRILAVAALSLLAAAASAQRIKCYEDNNGRRVCTDTIPPDAANLDREIRNGQGFVIGREEGEITAEEQRALEEQRRSEQERARLAEEERRYGQMLLDSYTSVSAIENMRDRAVAESKQQISLRQTYLESRYRQLEELERRAQRFAPYSENEDAPPLPDNLSLDIERTKSSIALFEKQVEDLERDQAETLDSFERDIEYFRRLKGEDA